MVKILTEQTVETAGIRPQGHFGFSCGFRWRLCFVMVVATATVENAETGPIKVRVARGIRGLMGVEAKEVRLVRGGPKIQ